MKKYRKIFTSIMLVALMMINSFTVLGVEGNLGSWEAKTPMITARDGLGVVESNGKIYAIGGHDGTTPFISTVEEYDPSTDTWITKSNMPTGRNSVGIIESNGKIYVIGGRTTNDITSSIVEEYNPITDTWTTKSNMPTKRNHMGVVALNGKIYAIGGILYSEGNYTALSVVEEYDPITDTWTTKSSMPTKRYGFGMSLFNGKIYAIGGHNKTSTLSTVEEYDPMTDTWTTKSNMPTVRSLLKSVQIYNKIYAIGGSDTNGWLSTVEEYDPETDTWIAKADMITSRHAFGATAYKGQIYTIGGSDSQGKLTNVEVFTPPISTVINSPTNLTATASSNSIVLNWDAVTDADSYTILRSTDSSTIDTVIASNITTTTYTDTNVTPGLTYYYVVRAVKNSVESGDSNIASAMVENNVATLQIKLSTTDIYEYKATMSDITNFIKWYTDRSNNTGLPFYIFPDNTNIEPYTKINEYIMHDKIVWFKVKEYLK